MAQKEATILILDVGPSMWKTRDETDNGSTHLEKACTAIQQILHSKIVGGRKTDLVGVVLLGSNITDNPLSDDGGYQRIKVHFEIGMADLELMKFITQECEHGKQPGDVLDAIVVAIAMLETHCKHLKWAKQIYLFTDAVPPIAPDPDDQIVSKAADYGVKTNVVGFGFTEDGPDDEDISRRANNERMLRNFAKKTSGQVFQGDEALSLLQELRSKTVNASRLISDNLVLGNPFAEDADGDGDGQKSSIVIAVHAFAKIKETKMPSGKKWSKVAAEAVDVDDEAVRGDVSMSRTYTVVQAALGDDGADGAAGGEDDLELQKEDLVKAYKYGKDLVPFSEEDKQAMKLNSTKGLFMLGFLKESDVPREYYLNDPIQVIPEPNSVRGDNTSLFEAMCVALKTKNMVGLVRYVRIKNAAPKLGILVPHIGRKIWCAWIQIPFKEDIREYSFPSLTPLLQDFSATSSQTLSQQSTVRPSTSASAAGATSTSRSHHGPGAHYGTQPGSASQIQTQASATLVSSIISDASKYSAMSLGKRKRLNQRLVASEEADARIDEFIMAMDLMGA
ncbi:X-ray repair cross-complementing protein 5, partial [Blyttiomyces sp. JEL0837]